ncbi:PhzF family phenazine biosynthesis protein [Actinocatenispora rupis]|uniref:Phenazine biosynthesis protein PhzF n=1 Tax=Actinocatenispora rupis TaxID=519421 RepID=A0A8J3JD44_9ACTN|nr:PhzF family phenazine biosynthesis protein [Actinocatenispora rupis]GID16141.1 phenazine biosynthesis protein PhzF [Actinocatenispora rupis]
MLRYEIVDVFTDRPFAGNPLAVVFGADGLADAQFQAVAREFNLSETAFVLPPVAGGDYRVRIFTPAAELPFAGHPSVGTATTLVRLGQLGAGDLVQECGAGNLPVAATASAARLTGGTPRIGAELDPAPLLAAVGLTADDHTGPAPRLAGCGIDSVHLAVRPDALARVDLDVAALRRTGHTLSVSAWDPAGRSARTRVFAADLGVPEDPATGSAALAYGVFLVATGLLPATGDHRYTVRQGVEMGRPSTLDCTVTAADGAAVAATVSGQVAPVAVGELQIPPA